MSRQRFQELVAELARLDPSRIRTYVHASLPRVALREAFDRATEGMQHAQLVDAAARVVVKEEILAGYRERVSGERPVAVARIHLVRRAAGG